MYEVKPAKGS